MTGLSLDLVLILSLGLLVELVAVVVRGGEDPVARGKLGESTKVDKE